MDEFPIPAPAFDGRSRAVPAANAIEWFKQGWALFLVNPAMWVAITLLTLLVFIGVQIVPWIGNLAAYLMTPLLLAGLVLSSRVGSGDPNIGVGFELQVIAAVIIGGTSLSGGEGRILGTVIGALIIGVLSNGLNLAGVEPFWQYVAQGVVLIAAVIIDRRVNLSVVKVGRRRSQS